MRRTLANLKASRIPEALNISSTDSRLVEYANEATERLLYRGKWHSTYAYYRVSATSRFFTPPPHLDTVETIAVENYPLPLRSVWYEFLKLGWGTRDRTLTNGSGLNECQLLGNYPVIADIATATTLTLKCDLHDDATKEVRILGTDANGNFIRTEPAGDGTGYEDGEVVALTQAGTVTTNTFATVTDIQAPSDLDGQWWLYAGTVATGTLLGNYEYWETNPMYKRYLIPWISTDVSTVEIMGKLAYRPLVNDTDYLIIPNLGALKLGMMAVKAEEEHNWAEANLLWNGGTMKDGTVRIGAIQELQAELDHHLGSGQEIGIHINNPSYAEAVEDLQ